MARGISIFYLLEQTVGISLFVFNSYVDVFQVLIMLNRHEFLSTFAVV